MAKRQLRMIRPELTTLPPLRIPRSYGLRTYQVGDDQHWAEIINNSSVEFCRCSQDEIYAVIKTS